MKTVQEGAEKGLQEPQKTVNEFEECSSGIQVPKETLYKRWPKNWGISDRSVRRILHEKLGMKPFKFKTRQKLTAEANCYSFNKKSL
jgi:hypothetical protein